MVKNKKLRNFIYLFIFVLLVLSTQIFNVLATPTSSQQQRLQENIAQNTSVEIQNAIANPTAVCEQDYVRTLNLITAEFYDELKEVVSQPTYDSVLIEDFKDAYLKAKYLIKLHLAKTNERREADLKSLTTASTTKQEDSIRIKIARDDKCLEVTQGYLDEIEHVYKATLSKSVEAKKGAVILEKYDQMNKQFESLLQIAEDSVNQFNKINDNLVCYLSECTSN